MWVRARDLVGEYRSFWRRHFCRVDRGQKNPFSGPGNAIRRHKSALFECSLLLAALSCLFIFESSLKCDEGSHRDTPALPTDTDRVPISGTYPLRDVIVYYADYILSKRHSEITRTGISFLIKSQIHLSWPIVPGFSLVDRKCSGFLRLFLFQLMINYN